MNEIEKRDIRPLLNNSADYLDKVLDQDDFRKFKSLTAELKDTWHKKQLFRTETEMRVSVLNDAKHPTKASKYWQCIREQNGFFESIMQLSFEYRKLEIGLKKIQKKIDETEDQLDKELLQIDLEQMIYSKANMELTAKDRIRELDLWSKLKKEIDDGSFDTQNVNTHQAESLKLILQNRANTLTKGSSQAEVLNVMGQLSTTERLEKENILLTNSNNNQKIQINTKLDEKVEINTKK
jgi:hypothetical protein